MKTETPFHVFLHNRSKESGWAKENNWFGSMNTCLQQQLRQKQAVPETELKIKIVYAGLIKGTPKKKNPIRDFGYGNVQ